jgi:hypothetical protein
VRTYLRSVPNERMTLYLGFSRTFTCSLTNNTRVVDVGVVDEVVSRQRTNWLLAN